MWADQGYTGDLGEWTQKHLGWRLEVVRRPTQEEHREKMWATARERQKAGATVAELYAGLTYDRRVDVLPRRWVVERTFAWLGRQRRLARDYEFLPETSEAMAYLAMTRLMLRRLAGLGKKRAGSGL